MSRSYKELRILLKKQGLATTIFPSDETFDIIFTLPSTNSADGYNYQRHEFLGDSVLNGAITWLIFTELKSAPEKVMHEIKKELIRNDGPLLTIAKDTLKLSNYIIGTIDNDSQYADVMEALLGALKDVAKNKGDTLNKIDTFIENLWRPYLQEILQKNAEQYKPYLKPLRKINECNSAASSSSSPVSVNKERATLKIERIKKKLHKQAFDKQVRYLCQLAGTSPQMLTLGKVKDLLSGFSEVERRKLLTTSCPEMRNTTPLQRFNKTGSVEVCAYLEAIASSPTAEVSHQPQNSISFAAVPSVSMFKPVASGSSGASSSKNITFTKTQRIFIASNSELAVDQQRLLSWIKMKNKQFPLDRFETLLSRISVERLQALWTTPFSGINGSKSMAFMSASKLQVDKLDILNKRLAVVTTAIHGSGGPSM